MTSVSILLRMSQSSCAPLLVRFLNRYGSIRSMPRPVSSLRFLAAAQTCGGSMGGISISIEWNRIATIASIISWYLRESRSQYPFQYLEKYSVFSTGSVRIVSPSSINSGSGGARSVCLVQAWAGPAPFSRAFVTQSLYDALSATPTCLVLACMMRANLFCALSYWGVPKRLAYEHQPLILPVTSWPCSSLISGGTSKQDILLLISVAAARCPLAVSSRAALSSELRW